jgi:hypothetical protein
MPKLKSLVRRRRALNEVLAPYPPQKQTRYISIETLRVERAELRSPEISVAFYRATQPKTICY